MAFGWEFPCDVWISFIPTVDANEEPMEHDESGKNSEDHEIIFQYWLAGVIDKTSRIETVAGRVCDCMPNNPVGFVEDF